MKKPGEYTHLSLPVTEIADLYMNAGPMSGVFSGLSMMDEDQAFILPIDTPFLEPEVGLQLLEHLDGFDIAAVSGTEMDQKVPASAYSKSCLPSIGKCLLLHQFTFDTLREKCSVSYLKREETTKDSDIPADLQFSHLDTRDDYYLALPAPSLHLTNLRTAADPASSLRKKSRPGTGCSTSAEGIVPEPA